MKYLEIPNSGQRLTDGNEVVLARFPNTRWFVRNGWYNYQSQQLNGWYFVSIPAGTVIPANEVDLHNIRVVSQDKATYCDNGHRHEPPKGPEPFDPCKTGHYDPCCPPPSGGGSCPPPHHEGHKICIAKYYPGTHYTKGQLVYLVTGELYQADTDFRSSHREDTANDNLRKDVQSGKLIPVPSYFEQALQDLETRINNRIDGIIINGGGGTLLQKYLMNFTTMFGKDVPTYADIAMFLASLTPAQVPTVGMYFRNTDTTSTTYQDIFSFYPDPQDESILLFLQDTKSQPAQGLSGSVVTGFTINQGLNGNLFVTLDMLDLSDGATTSVVEAVDPVSLGVWSQQSVTDIVSGMSMTFNATTRILSLTYNSNTIGGTVLPNTVQVTIPGTSAGSLPDQEIVQNISFTGNSDGLEISGNTVNLSTIGNPVAPFSYLISLEDLGAAPLSMLEWSEIY